eukprot:TRINITY_DN5806_c0_g1_i4.p1 TRINITY_DN5806_c0_g1~~TRINITY_DN5806_c0_g1_i4.p1  ORF type:complete len:324 (+),score=38.55 TRINITY_DN5806_c0_g1_i4:31-1002(+)
MHHTTKRKIGENTSIGIVGRIVRGSPWWGKGRYSEDVSFQEFVHWEEAVTILSIVIFHILGRAGVSNSRLRIGQFPQLLNQHINGDEVYTLSQFDTWLLALTLPHEYTQTWTQVYHSQRDGRGLSNFMNATKNVAASLVIIEDVEGNVFGAFTADKWERRATFYGYNGLSSFLFCLQSSVKMFHATGNNSNFQWSAQRYEGVPLGLGFGGQVSSFADIEDTRKQGSAFALFVESGFEWGYSGPSATYGNDGLAGADGEFKIKSIECWQVSLDKDDEDKKMGRNGSVLERFEKERNFIAITGQAQYSEGLTADIPEEHKTSLRV